MPPATRDASLSEYRIFETDRFLDDIEAITRGGQSQIVTKLRRHVYPQLRKSPRFGPYIRKLRGFEPETWRYRIGAWRFFFGIDDEEKVVFMIAAVHRSRAY